MTLKGVLAGLGKGTVLAAMLLVLTFAFAGSADASDSHDHHAVHKAAGPHAVHKAAGHHATEDGGGETGGTSHSDHDCHCLSAACAAPVLPSMVGDCVAAPPAATHVLPRAHDANALAGVDPPSKPPRT